MNKRLLATTAVLIAVVCASPAIASETATYTYDARGRLVAVERVSGPDTIQTSYTYDQADNRINVNTTGASSGDGGEGDTPSYRTRYIFNGRFYVSIVKQ